MRNISLKEMVKAFEAADSVMEILIKLSDEELKEKARRVKFLYSTESYDQRKSNKDYKPVIYFFARIDNEDVPVGWGFEFEEFSKMSNEDITQAAEDIYKFFELERRIKD